MSIQIDELRRMATNAYGDQKLILNKILMDINQLVKRNQALESENKELKKKLSGN